LPSFKALLRRPRQRRHKLAFPRQPVAHTKQFYAFIQVSTLKSPKRRQRIAQRRQLYAQSQAPPGPSARSGQASCTKRPMTGQIRGIAANRHTTARDSKPAVYPFDAI
jgi:hypothetical protein